MIYKAVKRSSFKTMPWGYKLHPRDKQLLEPIPEFLQELAKAFMFLDDSSYKDVAAWLSARTGEEITPHGLHWLKQNRRVDGSLKRAEASE